MRKSSWNFPDGGGDGGSRGGGCVPGENGGDGITLENFGLETTNCQVPTPPGHP